MWIQLKAPWKGKPAGERINLEDKDIADALVKGGIGVEVSEPISDVIGKAMSSALEGISGQIGKAFETALLQFSKATTLSRKNGTPLIFGEGNNGDPKRTFGSFLKAIRSRDLKTLEEMGSKMVEWGETNPSAKALSSAQGTTGGYTVPTEFYEKLMALVVERSIVRPRAMVIPMAAKEIEVPSLDHTTAPVAGDTAMLGGLVARWTEEGADKNETDPDFKQVKLVNYELSGYTKISNSMMADNAVGLESFLYDLFAKAVAWYEDYAFLRGNGVGKPLGAITWTGLISVARSAASAFALADFGGILARWLGSYDPRTSCIAMHPTVIAKVVTMNASGTGSPSVFLPAGEAMQKIKWMLGGMPVEITEKLPPLNTAGDVLLGDWSQYLVGDRQQIEIAFSEHAGFTTNQTFWRFVSRVGGQPWLRDKITLADATSTLSPFVTLAAG